MLLLHSSDLRSLPYEDSLPLLFYVPLYLLSLPYLLPLYLKPLLKLSKKMLKLKEKE